MILVFGKTGQVAKELQSLPDVIAIDRLEADLREPFACAQAIYKHKPKAVINAAAFTAVDKAEEQQEIATQINGISPGMMAEACADLDIPFIHISTDYVFDGSGQNAWKIDDKTDPQNAYGRSKLKGEQVIVASRATYAIIRTSWIISSFGNNFVKAMLSLSKTCESLSVVNDQVGGPTPAHDIAKSCLQIAQQLIDDPQKSGIYHFSGAPDVSWCEFANAIFEQAALNTTAYPIPTENYPTPAKRPLNSRLDCSAIKKTFNIAQSNWRDGLKDILENLEIKK